MQRDDDDLAVLSVVSPGVAPLMLKFTHHHVFTCHEESMYEIDAGELARMVAWIKAQADAGRDMLVHCSYGVARSSAIANAIAAQYHCTVRHYSRHISPRSDLFTATLAALT